MTEQFRGLYSIAQTPFDEVGAFLWEDFEREVDWIARAGAHGLVWPVMASEFTVISYLEKVRGMRVAVEAIAGRIPVVIGVAATTEAEATDLAREAGAVGADAIIAMPPWATKLVNHDLVRHYYASIADAAGLPVFVQNAGAPLGSSLPASFIVELFRDIPLVQYLKEEKPPQGQSISEVVEIADPAIKGVFSGGACRWLISQYHRGVCGSMPGSYITDIDAHIWNLLEAGDEAEAHRVHADKMVLENALGAMPARASKEVARRRGVISCAASRSFGALQLDAVDQADLDYAWSVVEPHFRI